MMTKRATLVLMLLGLLAGGLVPVAAAGFDAPSCPAMSTVSADAPLSWLPEPQPATGCTFRVTCPNGGTVQCSDPAFGECSYLYTCQPLRKCGVECLSTTKYCPGYNATNCAC